MDTFGQKLKQAVDKGCLRLEDVAQATGLDIVHIEALVRDDHGALPEDDTVTEGLQAFARLVDVDPDEVINDYRREREDYRRTALTDVDVAVVRDAPRDPDVVTQQPASRPARSPLLFALGAAALILAVAGFMWLWSSGRNETAPANAVSRNEVPMASAASPDAAGVQPAPVAEMEASAGPGIVPDGSSPVSRDQAQAAAMGTSEPSAPSETSKPVANVAPVVTAPAIGNFQTTTSVAPSPIAPPVSEAVMPSGLAIPHHGVGTGVVNHALIGEAERFAEGTRVWFWTWVDGATVGATIQHVWLHEGREMLSVPLRLGGERWRTQSYKNMHPGSTGQWVVEARDETGRVLARQAFQCFGPATD